MPAYINSIAWWPSVGALLIASATDLYSRRVPNWLTVPFLLSGIAIQAFTTGWPGAVQSLEGVCLASLLFGIPWLLQGMGAGDLKIAAGVGAWVGPGQFWMAFILTGIVGGVFALAYALWRGRLAACLDRTGDLLGHFKDKGLRPHESIQLDGPNAVSIPYAPAIAVGTLLSFFTR